MNAISTIEPATITPSAWPQVILRANVWRGHCTDIFARAEAAVSETLIVLAGVPQRGENITMPHLVGPRFVALAQALGPEGDFAVEGKMAAKAIAMFQVHDALRTMLCHGVATVTKDQKGNAYMIFHLRAFRGGKAQEEMAVFDEAQADAIAKKLLSDGQRLVDTLARVRKAVLSKPSV